MTNFECYLIKVRYDYFRLKIVLGMDQDERVSVRVVMVGETSVGKTSIIHRFINGSPLLQVRNTTGAVHHQKNIDVNGVRLSLEIWDTAGQERYRALGPVYYRNSNAAIAVFDVTSRETMESLEDWVKAYRSTSEYDFVVIVGNKIDLECEDKVDIEEAVEFGKTIGADCFFTSAVTGFGIDEVFNKVASYLAHTKMQLLNGIDFDDTTKKSDKCC